MFKILRETKFNIDYSLYKLYQKIRHRDNPAFLERIQLIDEYQCNYRRVIKQLKKQTRSGKKIRVCFFVMLDSAFAARSLYEKMLEDNFFDPFIVVIPDTSRGDEHMKFSFNQAYDSLFKKYQKVFKGYENDEFCDFLEKADIFYFPTPYNGMTYEYFEMEHFKNKDALLFYINYAYPVVKFAREIISLPTHDYFWKIFIENKGYISELKKYQLFKGKNAVISGYCKMDGLANQEIIQRQRKKIIIAPHHTISDWKLLKISNFLKYHKFFLELPKLYPNIDFVFRPHPLLIVQLRKPEFWGEEKTKKYFDKLEKYSNVMYSNGGEYFDIFANSDGIIHDCGSFLAEYLFTEKPACFILEEKKSIKEWFLPIGEKCLEHCYQAYSEKDIINYIENIILKNEDTLKKKRIKFVNSELKINYPKSSEFILDYIKNILIQ
ncbi:MAG: hypothetical protein UR66_C0017G0010 [Candidatus Moranbacteria bacterium GW2011_GWE1_35_17]|nr:MAG: hypothetical protein UR66_C0017G0010 [Candidatus Moranbacteria bacterium GW2011_GWE1_35_17]KKP89566.1 MAG: hypothetical protein UR95_C0007G0102 [Parcubacteria group bacterium GW2011_GWC1_36_108]HCU01665.1 hypothetical protein [Candidatus Nomurabacteria bacterium]